MPLKWKECPRSLHYQEIVGKFVTDGQVDSLKSKKVKRGLQRIVAEPITRCKTQIHNACCHSESYVTNREIHDQT